MFGERSGIKEDFKSFGEEPTSDKDYIKTGVDAFGLYRKKSMTENEVYRVGREVNGHVFFVDNEVPSLPSTDAEKSDNAVLNQIFRTYFRSLKEYWQDDGNFFTTRAAHLLEDIKICDLICARCQFDPEFCKETLKQLGLTKDILARVIRDKQPQEEHSENADWAAIVTQTVQAVWEGINAPKNGVKWELLDW
jgi:hypothetical protein